MAYALAPVVEAALSDQMSHWALQEASSTTSGLILIRSLASACMKSSLLVQCMQQTPSHAGSLAAATPHHDEFFCMVLGLAHGKQPYATGESVVLGYESHSCPSILSANVACSPACLLESEACWPYFLTRGMQWPFIDSSILSRFTGTSWSCVSKLSINSGS